MSFKFSNLGKEIKKKFEGGERIKNLELYTPLILINRPQIISHIKTKQLKIHISLTSRTSLSRNLSTPSALHVNSPQQTLQNQNLSFGLI